MPSPTNQTQDQPPPRDLLDGIDPPRLMSMVPQEHRWLSNLKKALYDCDTALVEGRAANRAFPEICNAIDVAATLHLSLLTPVENWQPPPHSKNKNKYVAFIHLEVPDRDNNGLNVALIDARSNKPIQYNYGELLYAIRCMVHENENLSADENPDYHVTLDWNMHENGRFAVMRDGRITCNARALLSRTRDVLVSFIQGIDLYMGIERGDTSFHLGPAPLQSIHPKDGRHSLNSPI